MTEKLRVMLKEDGAIKALLGMARIGNADVVAQVARGLANFAKCESRRIIQGLDEYVLRSHLVIRLIFVLGHAFEMFYFRILERPISSN